MATRSYKAQKLHDKIIIEAKSYLNQTDYNIYLNPGGYYNAIIGANCPDIIMTRRDTGNVAFIIEVETANTINLDEAKNQWKKYAEEINASFYLLVPFTHKNLAAKLCSQVGISARFGTYQLDNSGNIVNLQFE